MILEGEGCPLGKKTYASRREAASTLGKINARGKTRGKPEVYQCRTCHLYHIGRRPPYRRST